MRFLIAFALVVTAVACKPSMIPGTNIEDTEENRKVIEFLGKYRNAVLEKSADGVAGLCAADYFEDNGTVDQADDYGLAALKTRLHGDFEKTKEIQLEILVQKIMPPDDDIEETDAKNYVYKVAYRFNTRARVAFPAGEKWISISDVNQVVLRPDPTAGFLIVSGL